MPRFIRAGEGHDRDHGLVAVSGEHPELVSLVRAYSVPLVPDPESPLSVRDQYLSGVCRPRPVRDVTWSRLGVPRR